MVPLPSPIPVEYVSVANACAFAAVAIDPPTEQLTPWKLMVARKMNPAQVVEDIKRCTEACLADETCPGGRAFLKKALRQMDDPLFLTYVAGKLGAC